MAHFIFVIDGEAVAEFPMPNYGIQSDIVDKWVAIFSSDPKVVVSETPIIEGSTYDGSTFTPPA